MIRIVNYKVQINSACIAVKRRFKVFDNNQFLANNRKFKIKPLASICIYKRYLLSFFDKTLKNSEKVICESNSVDHDN